MTNGEDIVARPWYANSAEGKVGGRAAHSVCVGDNAARDRRTAGEHGCAATAYGRDEAEAERVAERVAADHNAALGAVHALEWSEQSDIRFACDGAMSRAPWCADPKAATWRADNGRLFAREAEDVTCVPCHQALARSRRVEGERASAAFVARRAAGLPTTLREALRDLDSARAENGRLRAVVEAVRREHNARAAWLAALPAGACASPPSQALLNAEGATREALRGAT